MAGGCQTSLPLYCVRFFWLRNDNLTNNPCRNDVPLMNWESKHFIYRVKMNFWPGFPVSQKHSWMIIDLSSSKTMTLLETVRVSPFRQRWKVVVLGFHIVVVFKVMTSKMTFTRHSCPSLAFSSICCFIIWRFVTVTFLLLQRLRIVWRSRVIILCDLLRTFTRDVFWQHWNSRLIQKTRTCHKIECTSI